VATRLQAKPRVLYICGWGRSGSTILDRVIGEAPGFVSVGELRSLWDADPATQLCGCGERVAECSLWGPILAAMSSASGYTMGSVRQLRDETSRTRHLLRLWRTARRDGRRPLPEAERYGDVLTGMYAAVRASTKSAIIVDSSKHPAEALLLASRPDVDLTVLHLVRDPRGAAYSWNKRSGATEHGSPRSGPPQRGILSSSAWWTTWNLVAESMIRPILGSRYLSLRYEDVMASPRDQLGAVVQRLGISAGDLPFSGANEVVLGPTHTVAGNPNRMGTGIVRLELDTEWKTALRGADRWKATIPALPMLHHFGYGVRSTREQHPPNRLGTFRA
jgi:hypothetical protein